MKGKDLRMVPKILTMKIFPEVVWDVNEFYAVIRFYFAMRKVLDLDLAGRTQKSASISLLDARNWFFAIGAGFAFLLIDFQ